MIGSLNWESASLEQTLAWGRRLGAALQVGHVVALQGPLGAGKTALVKGIAAGAGVTDTRQVTSPTFVLVNEYHANRGSGELIIHHVDAYRLCGGQDLVALGLDEMCGEGAVLIEWADRVAEVLPADRLVVTLEPLDASRRRFRIETQGDRSAGLWQAVAGFTASRGGPSTL